MIGFLVVREKGLRAFSFIFVPAGLPISAAKAADAPCTPELGSFLWVP
jgi:hypothetical protein